MPDSKTAEITPKLDTSNDDKLVTAVTAAVTAGLKTALPEVIKAMPEQINGGAIRRESPVERVEATIEDVSADDLAEAAIAGDKVRYATLLRQQRAADSQKQARDIARITQMGGAAFGSVAKIAAERLPHYKGKFKKIIDERIATFQANNPGVMITPDHYKAAHDIVVGENIEDILSGDREEVLRKAREPDAALIPDGGRQPIELEPKEPTALREVLAGDWGKEFRVKQRAVGGRSDDEELRKLGFRGGLAEFVKVRKDMDSFDEETGGTFGLDRDWVDEQGRSGTRANKEKGGWV